MPATAHSVLLLADLRTRDSGDLPQDADAAIVPAGSAAPANVVVVSEPGQVAASVAAAGLFLDFGQITNRVLIEAAALAGPAVLIDTTGATLKEVVRAVGWHQLAFRTGAPARHGAALFAGVPLILLHGVVGNAPWNLRAMTAMHTHTFVPGGLIDTSREGVGALAVAAGATVLVRAPAGFAQYAAAAHQAEKILGRAQKAPDGSELAAVHLARRRVLAARDLKAGDIITRTDLRFDPPGPADGELAPFQAASLPGRVLARDVAAGQAIRGDMLTGDGPQEAPWFSPRPPREQPGD